MLSYFSYVLLLTLTAKTPLDIVREETLARSDGSLKHIFVNFSIADWLKSVHIDKVLVPSDSLTYSHGSHQYRALLLTLNFKGRA